MVERAHLSDIASLTALRLEFLQEDCGELSGEIKSKLIEALPAYFEKNLNHKLAPLLRHTGGRFLPPRTSGCVTILYHAGRCNASHFLREFGA